MWEIIVEPSLYKFLPLKVSSTLFRAIHPSEISGLYVLPSHYSRTVLITCVRSCHAACEPLHTRSVTLSAS